MRNIELPDGQGYTALPDIEIDLAAGFTWYEYTFNETYDRLEVRGPWFGMENCRLIRLGRTELDWIQQHIELFDQRSRDRVWRACEEVRKWRDTPAGYKDERLGRDYGIGITNGVLNPGQLYEAHAQQWPGTQRATGATITTTQNTTMVVYPPVPPPDDDDVELQFGQTGEGVAEAITPQPGQPQTAGGMVWNTLTGQPYLWTGNRWHGLGLPVDPDPNPTPANGDMWTVNGVQHAHVNDENVRLLPEVNIQMTTEGVINRGRQPNG
jgi:hypothetical protein